MGLSELERLATILRVLFLSIYDPYGSRFGGARNHLSNLSEALKKLGCEIHILIPGAKTGLRMENGIFVHSLSSHFFKKSFGNGIIFGSSSFRVVDKICEAYKIDIIHSQSPSGFGYALFGKKSRPFVVTLHGTSFGEISSYSNVPLSNVSFALLRDELVVQPLWAMFTSIEYQKATKLIAVSKFVAQEAESFYHLPKAKIECIYSGVNLPELEKFPTNVVDENGRNVLFVGRLVWRKGAQYLIEATPRILSEYPDVKIKIVGSGEQRPLLEERVKHLGIDGSVKFLGKVSADMLRRLYSEADVCVQPSLYEPLGISVLEAMSFGKPVVASRVGGIPEMITNEEEGVLFEPGNILQLSEAIKNLLSDSTLKKEYGHNARKKVETDFTWLKMAQKTIDLYESLLA